MKLPGIVFVSLMLISCGGTSYVEVDKLPDTYQCSHMDEVCKEAREFEANYARMNKEEKEEFRTLLDTYKSQCHTALEHCRKSGK